MKECPSYPGYAVTKDGHVFTHRRRYGKGRGYGGGVQVDMSFVKELKFTVGHGAYLYVSVSTDRGQRSIPLHVLLLDAFVSPRPENMEIRHLDGNPTNNRLGNLCYGTVKENASDRIKHGTQPHGSSHGRSRLVEDQVRAIRQVYSLGNISIASLARDYKVGGSTIRDIVKGRKWMHVC